MAVVAVADDGRGLAPEDLDRVFERFYRVDEKASPGTGVGLTIARALARAHNGDVSVSSPGLGKGATFEITIPVAGV
jgi:signal transduction histidine kinase